MDIKIKYNNIKFKYRVSGIFINNNKLLVDTYDNNNYYLPGGYVHINEASTNALLREMKEKLNLDFKIINFKGITEDFFYDRNNEYTHAIVLYYIVELSNKNDYDKIDYNYIENDNGNIINHHYKWIDINNLDNYNVLPNSIKEYIKDNKEFNIINNI